MKYHEKKIVDAIHKASAKGIGQYLWLMQQLPLVDVSCDLEFQRKYKYFYRVRRGQSWCNEYFQLMQDNKGNSITFEKVIESVSSIEGRVESSFSSKLFATLDPEQPIWDKFVLKNLGLRAPTGPDKDARMHKAIKIYKEIQNEYADKIESSDGKAMIALFDQMIPEHEKITALKKIDFILWQMRT